MLFKQKITLYLFAFLGLCQSCVEPIEFEPDEYENILAVRATITDSLETQKVYLSRTFSFGEEGPAPESNAQVWIIDNNGNEYKFEESESGEYLSVNDFMAQPGAAYQLQIETSDGVSYSSDSTQLAQSTPIDNVEPRRLDINGRNGVAIHVNNFNSNEAANF